MSHCAQMRSYGRSRNGAHRPLASSGATALSAEDATSLANICRGVYRAAEASNSSRLISTR